MHAVTSEDETRRENGPRESDSGRALAYVVRARFAFGFAVPRPGSSPVRCGVPPWYRVVGVEFGRGAIQPYARKNAF